LISPYPKNKSVDRILENLGEDFNNDTLHDQSWENPDAEIEDGDQDSDASSVSSDEDVAAAAAGAEGVYAADAGDAGAEAADVETIDAVILPLSAPQAEQVHDTMTTISAIEATIDELKSVGLVRGVQAMESQLSKEKRRMRAAITEDPAVADTFLRMRTAELVQDLERKKALAQLNNRKREATKAIADRDTAIADLKRTKKAIQDMEGIRASKHEVKRFLLADLGEGDAKAGGAASKKKRLEVLDRLSRLGSGLSPGQVNDWQWFKHEWDKQMATIYQKEWASTFSAWMQDVMNVLDDGTSTAFSEFVYNETRRIFTGTVALHVPGS